MQSASALQGPTKRTHRPVFVSQTLPVAHGSAFDWAQPVLQRELSQIIRGAPHSMSVMQGCWPGTNVATGRKPARPSSRVGAIGAATSTQTEFATSHFKPAGQPTSAVHGGASAKHALLTHNSPLGQSPLVMHGNAAGLSAAQPTVANTPTHSNVAIRAVIVVSTCIDIPGSGRSRPVLLRFFDGLGVTAEFFTVVGVVGRRREPHHLIGCVLTWRM